MAQAPPDIATYDSLQIDQAVMSQKPLKLLCRAAIFDRIE
jgi:hypothetical protein